MKKRVISAVIAIAILIPLFIIGGIPFITAVGLLAAQAYKETMGLKESHKPYPALIQIIGLFLTVIIVILHPNAAYLFNGIEAVLLAPLFLLLLIPAIFDSKGKYTTKEAFHLCGTVLFIGIVFHLFIMLYSASKWLFLYLILIATVTDTFAYIVGSLTGKHKLIPEVSPKKSIEGSIGGTIAGTAVAAIFYYNVVTNTISIPVLIIMTLFLSILGQLGDLFFSKIKRENGIKDFSNIMPGHGGVLDRVDSMVFIALGYTFIIAILNLF
jgi:phosphatidate cytidylyltransferase